MGENSETEILLDVAVLGEQVSQFFKTDMGKFILQRIETEVQEGLWELRKVNPHDPQKVWDAQQKVWRAESIKQWFDDAIMAGLKAQEVLEDREE